MRRTGRRSASLTSATATGVTAVAMIVPVCQKSGTTMAAVTADNVEIASV